ncbi:MAG: DoxX family protein [Planctomycetes bacterium]|nr:DoxX family protein [Planctomycetota bacterium]
MARFLVPRSHPASVSFGIFLARVVTGAALGIHGLPKLQNLTTWGEGMGFPAALLPVGAIAEGVFGWLLAIGFLSPFAALMCAGVMAGAVWFHVGQGHAFAATAPNQAAFELAAVYCSVSLLVLFAGPGSLSVDKFVFKPRDGGGQ